jgi:hypothetical protein
MSPSYIMSVLHGLAEIPQDADKLAELIEAVEREPGLYLTNGAGCRGYEQLKAIYEGGLL